METNTNIAGELPGRASIIGTMLYGLKWYIEYKERQAFGDVKVVADLEKGGKLHLEKGGKAATDEWLTYQVKIVLATPVDMRDLHE